MMDNCKSKCSRPPKLLKSNAYQPVSNTLAGQTLIYMQMSNHYRRLENAKSIVDSGLHGHSPKSRLGSYYDTGASKNYNTPNPCEYSCSRRSNLYSASSTRTNLNDTSLYSPSPSDMELVDQIVYDDKHKPNAFYKDAHGLVYAPTSHIQCVKARDIKNKRTSSKPRPKSSSRSPEKPILKKFQKPSVPMDIMDHHPKQFVPCKNFQPRILKSTAQSRVQNLSVYHAPRRRPDPQEKIWLTDSQIQLLDQVNEVESHKVHYKHPWNFEESEIKHSDMDKRPSSKDSSRSYGCDSAYCGGVSSGGGSRGSTPERCPAVKKMPPLKSDLVFNEETYSSADSQDFPMSVDPPKNWEVEFAENGYAGKRNQEAAYATFLRKITEDILERGIFTDKGINSIFQRHVEENKYELDQARMQLEVSNLRKQLGIVDDVENTYFEGGKAKMLRPRATILNPTKFNDVHSSSTFCTSGCHTQALEKPCPEDILCNKNANNPAIEDIISDMEHCVKIDAHAAETSCCCPNLVNTNELGCGCDKTCTEAKNFGQLIENDRTIAGNMFYMAEEVDNISYCMAEPQAEPNESKYCVEPESVRSYDDIVQTDQEPPDGYQDDRMSDIDTDEDIKTKSSKSWSRTSRGQGSSKMSYDVMNKSKTSSSEANNKTSSSEASEGEDDVGDSEENDDSTGIAHEESLCSHIKTKSSDDFLLEKFAMAELIDSNSHNERVISKTDMLGIKSSDSDDKLSENSSDRSESFEKQLEESELESDNSDSESDVEKLQQDDTGDGRTVFFNKSPERESSMETLHDSKGNRLDRVMNGTGPEVEDELESASRTFTSKALVTFASDKNTPTSSADLSGVPEDPKKVSSNKHTNLDRLRRDQQPSKEKNGCFGPCMKKKKASPTAPPPLKSALKSKKVNED